MSKQKVLVYSTEKLSDRVIDQLRSDYADELDLVFHIGNRRTDLKASSLRRMKIDSSSTRFAFDRTYFNALAVRYSEDRAFADSLYEFVDHLQRTNFEYSYKSNPIQYVHEAYDYFHLALEYAVGILREYEVEQILFFNIPHLGCDTIFYLAARLLNVRTTILSQTLFPGKFFSTTGVDAFGNFQISSNPEITRYPITGKSDLNLFYMKSISNTADRSSGLSIRAILTFFAYVLLKDPRLLLKPLKLTSMLNRATDISQRFPRWRDPFAHFFNKPGLDYFEHLAAVQDFNLDLDKPFVYFALQLQPEMTTSALGKLFVDQALAIESLANLLPEGVRIFVKENPKQMAYMRGPMFFHRLRRIPNVHIAPVHLDTHLLTDRSLFVSTITGTVGWEAICKGKRALVFGLPWYRALPGVTLYRPGMSYEDIFSTRFDHADLERATGELLSRCHEGVIDRHYTQVVEEFNSESNAVMAARSIAGLLTGRLAHTFR